MGAGRPESSGRSPRVRGSPHRARRRIAKLRSIPAGAGEPEHEQHDYHHPEVHPRGCGGALDGTPVEGASFGPSPRVRGSRSCSPRIQAWIGSIPAGAEEPMKRKRWARRPAVHPRGCGGAVKACFRAEYCRGPSPRVRGSHESLERARARLGSIPAGAGEPRAR